MIQTLFMQRPLELISQHFTQYTFLFVTYIAYVAHFVQFNMVLIWYCLSHQALRQILFIFRPQVTLYGSTSWLSQSFLHQQLLKVESLLHVWTIRSTSLLTRANRYVCKYFILTIHLCVQNFIYDYNLGTSTLTITFKIFLLQIWQFKTENHIFSSPVTFTGTSDAEACPSVSDCSERTDANPQQFQSEKILIGSHDHHLYCLDRNGKMMWKYGMNSPVYSTPFIFATGSCSNNCPNDDIKDSCTLNPTMLKHYAVICSTMGQVNIIDVPNGKLVCTTDVPGEVFSSPVVCGNKLVVGCRNDNVYCFQMIFK